MRAYIICCCFVGEANAQEEYRKSGQRTVTEAVYAAGFGSYAQFYKVFTNAYGHGPRNLLKK